MNDVCAIVVSHNNRQCLDAAIGSLKAHAGHLDLDVVVVDNGTDGAAEHVQSRFPFVRTINCENRGFAHANNRALETADARYVLLLNPDTEILEGRISDLVSEMDGCPEVALAGVRQVRPDGTLAPSIRRFPSITHTLAESLGTEHVSILNRFLGERDLDPRSYERVTPCDWTSGSFMLVRRASLDSVGWLDERYFLFSEETDLCWRLRKEGWKVIHTPTVTIRHDESDGWANTRLVAQNAYARMQFAEKHFSRLRRAIYRASLAFRYSLRVVLYATCRRSDPGRREAVEGSLRTVLGNHAPFPQVMSTRTVDLPNHGTSVQS